MDGYMYVCTYTYMYIWIYTYVYIYILYYIYMDMYVYIYGYLDILISMDIYIYIFGYMGIYVDICPMVASTIETHMKLSRILKLWVVNYLSIMVAKGKFWRLMVRWTIKLGKYQQNILSLWKDRNHRVVMYDSSLQHTWTNPSIDIHVKPYLEFPRFIFRTN